MPNAVQPQTTDCDRCGRECLEGGYEIRYFGPRDPATNYQDEQVVCRACLDDEAEQMAMDDEDEAYWAAGDQRFTEMYECGEI